MRDAFFSELLALLKQDDRVVFLTGDLGFKLIDSLRDSAPDRVMNCGLREAGMVGLAAGMAKMGMLPFVYSITPFLTLRCLEQLKIDLCYNRSRVVIVGVGGGFAYGPNASSHHGVDDIGVVSCLPGMTVWTPADPREVRECVRAASQLTGPAYLRLGRSGEPHVHPGDGACPDIDQPLLFGEAEDGIIATCGSILPEVLRAVEILKSQGIYPGVVRLTRLRPFPDDFLRKIIGTGKPVMTVEEHVSTGGLGQHVAAIVAEEGEGNPFKILSIPLTFPDACQSREALLQMAGLDASTIVGHFKKLAEEYALRPRT
jgi:transketolase